MDIQSISKSMHKRWLFSGLAICLIIVGLFYFKTVSAVYECERGFKCIYGNANGLKFEVDDGFPINFKSNDINFFDLSDSLIFSVGEGNFDIPGNLTVSGATSFDNGAIATNGSGNFTTNISTLGIVNTASGIRLSNLVGYSNRLLTVDSVGNLITSTATVYGVVSTSTYATTAGTAKALSLTTNPTDCAAGQYARGITANGSAEGCTAVAGGVGGSGTAGYSAKWTAATTLGNGSVYDNGSGISLGTKTVSTKLNISHQAAFNSTTPGTGLYGLHFIGQTTADQASGITWNGGSSGAQAGIYVQGSGGYGTKMYLATTNAYATGAQTRMMINANGNVGIGDNAPGDKLSVSGVVKGTYLKTSSVVSCTNGIITSATGQLACNSSAFITSAAIPNISFTAIGSAPNANGALVSGHTITLQPANGSYGGVVTAGAQTFAGTKTFSSTIVGNISGTAAALAANPANCPAGQYPLGIAANGAAEGCTAINTTDQYWTGTATNLNAATGRTSLGLGALATLGAVATGQITDGTIIDADISASANIASSKIANGTYFITSAGTSGQVWKSDGNGAGVWGDLPSVTGDNLGDHTAEANIKLIGPKESFWLSGDGGNEGLTVSSAGAVKFSSLAGTGSRMVVTAADGTISATTIPSIPATNITGSAAGTANYIPKYTANYTLANSSIYDNGKIGLGNTSPLARLHVSSGGNTLTSYTALFDSSGSTPGAGGVVFAQNSTYGFKMYPVGTSGTSGTLNFSYINKSNGTSQKDNLLVIGANGNIGIGTTSPVSKLSVNGNIKTTGSVTAADEMLIAGNDVCHSGNNCGSVIDAMTYRGFQLVANNGAAAINSGIVITGSATTSYTYTFGDGANSKINVGTVDPLYTIGGKRYATYMAGMTGVKEETSGVLSLTKQSAGLFMAKFDFDDDPEGTDIWLFGRTTNLVKNKDVFDQAACLLTANFAGQTWYEKDWQEKTISIFAKPDNSRRENVEVSYRLTAPRFDYLKWTNHSEEPAEGFNLDKLLR